MKHFPRIPVLFCFIVMTILSCEKDDLNGDVVVDSQLLDKLYLNSEDTIRIDNQNLVLQTELSRNFFPGAYKKSTRLVASIDIVNIDGSQISTKFEIKNLHVINKEQIWFSNPKPYESLNMPINEVHRVSVDGPEWETGIYVDVVLLIEDLTTREIKYLIARNQIIERVE